jgi:two-component system OmpR family response regulator
VPIAQYARAHPYPGWARVIPSRNTLTTNYMQATLMAASSSRTHVARERSPVRVLVVQHDPKLGSVLARGFAGTSFTVDLVTTGQYGIACALVADYAVIVLDAELPDSDGFEVCRTLRHEQIVAPVLMLLGRDTVTERAYSLGSGAHGYLVKPFSFGDLLDRVQAMSRRASVERHPGLKVGDLRLDAARHQVRRSEVPINLSRREYAVLEALMRRPGEVLSRFELLEKVWGPDHEDRSNVVQVYIRYLRMKIDRPFGRNSLQTVRGVGYRICDDK